MRGKDVMWIMIEGKDMDYTSQTFASGQDGEQKKHGQGVWGYVAEIRALKMEEGIKKR